MRPELKKVIGIIGGWLLMAVAMWVLLPVDFIGLTIPREIAWLPIAVIIVALVVSSIGILLMRLGFFRPVVAIVNHKKVKSCMDCPSRFMKDNPFSPSLPICKCKDKGMRTCYSPKKVPRWCPHAIRS